LDYVTKQQGSASQGEKIWGKGTTLMAGFVGVAGLIYAVWPK